MCIRDSREGVQFQDLIYEEALKKAGKEGKMVFMDCYTVWCGPCKMMNERVFTQKVVGDYFKKHFIPLKVDMEKGEGIALRKKFDVNAFPTMFILDAEGNIVGKLQGSLDTDCLLYTSFYSFCKSSEGTGSVAGWFCKTQFVGKAFVYFPIECNFLKKQ